MKISKIEKKWEWYVKQQSEDKKKKNPQGEIC